jgi:outer membrane protein OmpA-like peptidoglycan-associated protein
MRHLVYRRWVLVFAGLIIGPALATEDCATGESLYQQAVETVVPRQRITLLEQAIALCPTFTAWYTAGQTYLELQQPDTALTAFETARRLAEDAHYQGLALGRAGEAYLAQGAEAEAVGAVNSAIERFTERPPPDWLIELRRQLDRMTAGQVIPAEQLKKTLSLSRSFSSVPSVQIRVQFAYDSAVLDDAGRLQVNELGKALVDLQGSARRIQVIGHTDIQGSESYNQQLSEQRANTVAIALTRSFPALAGQLATSGRGEAEPIYEGDSEEDHYLNRRVEVQLLP